ncbi:hypothetical protein DBV15_05643 [Temnothorax longispinosus]|uniref:RNF34/RFFL HeH domain-containing protein n=1 Tax=Temnothorax longispinosus TaxID=300112 RepID=A0A4S2K4V9_9HYME|nr:hypothetical protein DBV15_05643 [Temnothorax longispinosus]
MRGLPEVLLFRMRDQTAGQGVHLRQLRPVVQEAAYQESNQTNTFEGLTSVPCGEEGFCQGLRRSRIDPGSNRMENMPNVSTANNEPDAEAPAEPVRNEDVEMAEEASESSDSSPIISVPFSSDNESPGEKPTKGSDVEIEEVFESDNNPTGPSTAPEPVITEQEEVPETSDEKKSDMVTEIPTWSDKVQLSDIKEASELEYLSIKQLKNLLSTNRVDYKGCIERQDLLNKVSRLWHEYSQSRKDVEKLSEEELCKICWDAPIECVILECGHMACCINCAQSLSNGTIVDCGQEHQKQHKPLCKAIRDALRDYNMDDRGETTEEWAGKKLTFMRLVSSRLGRPLNLDETEMFYFSRECLVCHERDAQSLKDCQKCVASFCQNHKDGEKSSSPYLHSYLQHVSYMGTFQNMKDFIKAFGNIQTDSEMLYNVLAAVQSDHLTCSLTLFHALQLLNYVPKSKNLVIHSLGANCAEENLERLGNFAAFNRNHGVSGSYIYRAGINT